jgi:uncharacterized ParB-like nuclease family protein
VDDAAEHDLRLKRTALRRTLASFGSFVRGSVVLMKRRCTYPGCRKCASGQHHPTWVLTVSRKGKTHTVYLGPQRRVQAQQMAGNYRRLLALLEELAEVNLALLTGKPLEGKGGRHGTPGPGT